MKKLKLTKVIASSLVVASVLALNPIGASAEWKQDSKGWWNTEGSSYSIGWKQIDGKWYYFNSDGYMAHDTAIDGYYLNSNGAYVSNNSTSNNYSKEIKKPITYLTNEEVSKLPTVKLTNNKVKSINSISKSNGKLHLKEEVLDANGNTITTATVSKTGRNPLEIAGKVETALYKDSNGNVVFKTRVKDNKLYYYDNNDKPLINTIVNGQVTDDTGAWIVGDVLKMMSIPTNNRNLDLKAYPEQLSEIKLCINSNSVVYNYNYNTNTNESTNVQNINLVVNNNDSDFDNNIGDITFDDRFEVYRLSDDHAEWIDALMPLSEGNTESNNVNKYTIPYRGYYNIWLKEGGYWYDKVFSKSGTYLIVCDSLGLADVVNIKCK